MWWCHFSRRTDSSTSRAQTEQTIVTQSFILHFAKVHRSGEMAYAGRGRGRGRGRRPEMENTNSPAVEDVQEEMAQVSVVDYESIIQETARNYIAQNNRRRGTPRGSVRGARMVYDPPQRRETVATSVKTMPTTPVEVAINSFPLKRIPLFKLSQYHVEFEPSGIPLYERKQIIESYFLKHGNTNRKIFDGCQLYSIDQLDLNDEHMEKFGIRIVFTGEVAIGDPKFIQIFNLLGRQWLFYIGLTEVGDEYFDMNAMNKQVGLEIMEGYRATLHVCQGNILYNVDVVRKVLQKCSFVGKYNEDHYKMTELRQNIKNELVGKRIMTIYNQRTYLVHDVDFDSNPKSTFFSAKDSKEISYIEYYKSRYDEVIKDMCQPLLVANVRGMDKRQPKELRFVPELCRIVGRPDNQTERERQELGRHLQLSASQRANKIIELMRTIKLNQRVQVESSEWGFEYEDDMLRLQAKVVQPEAIITGNANRCTLDAYGNLPQNKLKMLDPVHIKKWALLFPNSVSSQIQCFMTSMKKAASKLGIDLESPKLERVSGDRLRYEDYLRIIGKVKDEIQGLQLVFIIIPTGNDILYAAAKLKLTKDIGLPSQCFREANLYVKHVNSVAFGTMVQMDVKIGATAWKVSLKAHSMFVGYAEPEREYQRAGSDLIGSLCASTTKSPGVYHNETIKRGEKLSDGFEKILTNYARQNNDGRQSLEHVFFCRQGVGEGDLVRVCKDELTGLRDALRKVFPAATPKLTLVVVTRRNNMRIFQMKENAYTNPEIGLILDDVHVMDPSRLQFYMTSVYARQGSPCPPLYDILFDESELPFNNIQWVLFKLCHTYYNWLGTISVPSPVQYAMKLCELMVTMKTAYYNPNLQHQLHFL